MQHSPAIGGGGGGVVVVGGGGGGVVVVVVVVVAVGRGGGSPRPRVMVAARPGYVGNKIVMPTVMIVLMTTITMRMVEVAMAAKLTLFLILFLAG